MKLAMVNIDEQLYVPSKGRIFRALLTFISAEDKAKLELYCLENGKSMADFVYAIYLKNQHKLASLFKNDEIGRRHELLMKDKLTFAEKHELYVLKCRQEARRTEPQPIGD